LVEPGGDRGAQPVDGKPIELPGHRHHQRLVFIPQQLGGLDPHHLLGSRTPSTHLRTGLADTGLGHSRTLSGPLRRWSRECSGIRLLITNRGRVVNNVALSGGR
jgi:hypothetical protein